MRQPQFGNDPFHQPQNPGARHSVAGPTVEERLAALEQSVRMFNPQAPASGYVKTSDTTQTGGVKWKYGSGELSCKLYRVGALNTAASAGWQIITGLNTALYDHHPGTAQADTSNGRIYCRVTGIYQVYAQIGISATWAGLKGLSIYKNGAANGSNGGHTHWRADGDSFHYRAISAEVLATAGDYFNLAWFDDSGVARALDVTFVGLSMSLVRAS